MSSPLDQLNQRFAQGLANFCPAELPQPLVVTATNAKFGDFQCNIALPLAKILGQSPRTIAAQIVERVDLSDICEPSVIAGPGFINLTLQKSYLAGQIQALQQDSRLGVVNAGQGSRVIVDFSSPNIAKEMHVGHLRSTIIGDCLARILELRGYDVLRLNHLGDWGTQFGMLITYLKEVCPQALNHADALELGDLVTFYKQAKARFDQDEIFKEASRQSVVALQKGEPESLVAWQLLCAQSRREFQQIYQQLAIEITERGESFYNPFLGDVVTALKKQGLLVEDQGAQCVFLNGFTNKEGQPLPLIIQKSDGGYNYATTDLAALKYRFQVDKAEKIIYVTDAGQANHFAQVFQVAHKAGFIPSMEAVVHVPFGLVKGEDGKKLKTRSGDIIRLKDLLQEAVSHARQNLQSRLMLEERQETTDFVETVSRVVGIAAVKYADLSQNRLSDYIFSYDKMLSLQGNTAPYLLYAYARIQSIARQGLLDWGELALEPSLTFSANSEIELGKGLLQFADVITEVENTLLPNRLCDYLYELSKKFNRFYEECSVLKAEGSTRQSRLVLCELTARILKLGLALLGIPVLERL